MCRIILKILNKLLINNSYTVEVQSSFFFKNVVQLYQLFFLRFSRNGRGNFYLSTFTPADTTLGQKPRYSVCSCSLSKICQMRVCTCQICTFGKYCRTDSGRSRYVHIIYTYKYICIIDNIIPPCHRLRNCQWSVTAHRSDFIFFRLESDNENVGEYIQWWKLITIIIYTRINNGQYLSTLSSISYDTLSISTYISIKLSSFV